LFEEDQLERFLLAAKPTARMVQLYLKWMDGCGCTSNLDGFNESNARDVNVEIESSLRGIIVLSRGGFWWH
jgi:hypothetical protein